MTQVLLSLGTNLPPKQKHLNAMQEELQNLLGNCRFSSLYSTAPVCVSADHDTYLNQVVLGEWCGDALELLRQTQMIEKKLGRTDKGNLAPRTADIDILLFGNQQIDVEHLVVPHHALLDRHFHVLGLRELVPNWLVPGKKVSFEHYRIDNAVAQQCVEYVE